MSANGGPPVYTPIRDATSVRDLSEYFRHFLLFSLTCCEICVLCQHILSI